MESENQYCINCEQPVASHYCPNCGQPHPPRRITVRKMWDDFQSRIYGFDGMFPRTLRDITIRPGKATRTFISGNRVMYYGPVGYFFLMVTLMLLIMSMLDVNVVDFLKAAGKYSMTVPDVNTSQARFNESILKIASDNIKVLSFAMIPVQAFCARFLFFRKNGFNFLENTVLPFYVQGHVYWLSIFNVICYKITGSFFPFWLSPLLILSYFAFSYSTLTNQSKVKGFLKGLGIYFTAQFLFGLIIGIIVFIAILVSPEVREMIRP